MSDNVPETTITKILAELTQLVDEVRQLREHVNLQNGRVGRLEDLGEAHEDAITQWSEQFGTLSMTIAATVRKELTRNRTEQAAERYEQLKSIGWRIVLGAIGSSTIIGFVIERFIS